MHDAGFGSWLMESLSENRELRARIINIAYDPVVAGSVGSEHYLNMVGGLTENICQWFKSQGLDMKERRLSHYLNPDSFRYG